MEPMDEFLRRQREGAAVNVEAYGDLTAARADLTAAQLRAAQQVKTIPGGQRDRERAAARAVRGVFAHNAERSREKAKDVLSAVADLSKNWGEHQDLWDDLGPEDLAVVEDTVASWEGLRQAAIDAREADRTLQASVGSFRSLGPDAANVSDDLLSALTATASASSELSALADEYLGQLYEIRRRLQ